MQASHTQSDQILSGIACNVLLGDANFTGSGIQAIGSTVVECPIYRENALTLTRVFVRMKPASGGGARSFCNLTSFDSRNTESDTGDLRFVNNTTTAQSLDLQIPNTFGSGYVTLLCNLVNNDILHGIRYLEN